MRRSLGFTVAELIVSLAIISIIATISISSFAEYNRREVVKTTGASLASALREARSRTLASIDASSFGVKIDADRFTLFKGNTFSSSTADTPFMFHPTIEASTTIPVIIFSRVTGNASVSGTINVFLRNTPGAKSTVDIQTTGLVNLVQ